MKKYFYTLMAVILLLGTSSWATVIYVSGDQTGTWSADTVIVTAEVRVPPGESLSILPGVEVLFSAYCKLIVDNGATLLAVGTAADSIRFDVLPPNANWHGIRFLAASDSSRLEHCILTRGSATGGGEDGYGGAIYCSSSNLTISHNTISGNMALYAGGIYCDNSDPTINNNIISEDSASWGGGICCNNNSNPIISGNTISGNHSAGHTGGGIRCDNSSPSISDNTISGNTAFYGGGIYCLGGSPILSGNTISGNSAPYGGGIFCDYSNASINDNTISENSATDYGGGFYCSVSSPIICGNTISNNSAVFGGGGIYCYSGSPIISENTISLNSSGLGGAIMCYESIPSISGNAINENSATTGGGGIYCELSSSTISGNTISSNSGLGGGILCYGGSAIMVNCIIWGNRPQQIYVISTSLEVTYSDIQDGWTGTGNIATYPAFVDTAQDDYRLQWGSPCMDTGDPNPIYNDPDGTRADMGAWYYDQSMPVRVLLTPYNAPIQIPAEGGSFQYAIQATNIASSTLLVPLWCNLTLPSGMPYGPVLGPVRISLGSGQTISRVRTQNISAHAPEGMYHYNGYAIAAGDTSTDSFTFMKLGAGGWDLGADGWTNTGQSFEGQEEAVLIHPSSFRLHPSHPNPFNPTTAIGFELRAASFMTLRIYDTAGRLVATLVDGWRDAGTQEATFDGSGLPSGIYFAKLTAGDYSQVQKLVLLK